MAGLSYPFMTKNQIRERVESDREFAIECVAVMQARHELRLGGGGGLGACGWMSSQASTASKLAKKLAAGEATEEEVDQIVAIVGRYAKQLAAHFRERALTDNPGLAEAAAKFGVLPDAPAVAAAGAQERQEEPAVPEKSAAASEPPPPPSEPPARTGCEECQGILDLIGEDGARTGEVAQALGVETAEVSKHLRDLVEAGLVRRTGVGRGTRYSRT